MATRKPRSSYLLRESSQPRSADRNLNGPLSHEPPRSTRGLSLEMLAFNTDECAPQ